MATSNLGRLKMGRRDFDLGELRNLVRELDRLHYSHVAHALMLASTSQSSLREHEEELVELVALARKLLSRKRH